jgi:hypothetical protein
MLTASATATTLKEASRQGAAIDAERPNRFLKQESHVGRAAVMCCPRIRPGAVCRREGTPCWSIWNNKRS